MFSLYLNTQTKVQIYWLVIYHNIEPRKAAPTDKYRSITETVNETLPVLSVLSSCHLGRGKKKKWTLNNHLQACLCGFSWIWIHWTSLFMELFSRAARAHPRSTRTVCSLYSRRRHRCLLPASVFPSPHTPGSFSQMHTSPQDGSCCRSAEEAVSVFVNPFRVAVERKSLHVFLFFSLCRICF